MLRKLIIGSGESFKARVVETLNEIIDTLAARRIRGGPGVRVCESPCGITISAERPAPSGGGGVRITPPVYAGPHAVTYDPETGKVEVTAGYVLQNGAFAQTAAASLTPQTGVICVTNALSNGVWSTPTIAFATPSELAYPIGACTVTGSGASAAVTIECYVQPVAILFDVGDCEA